MVLQPSLCTQANHKSIRFCSNYVCSVRQMTDIAFKKKKKKAVKNYLACFMSAEAIKALLVSPLQDSLSCKFRTTFKCPENGYSQKYCNL